MNSGVTRPETLDAVRELEQRLDDRRAVEDAAAAAIAEARAEAARLVAKARAEADLAAAELRHRTEREAEREAERVVAEARATAELLAARAETDREQAVDAVIRLLTPPSRAGS